MKISFPAMEGVMGGRKYYSCLMKLRVIPKMFTFRDWAEFTPEQREQRVLNKKRVPDIARYVVDNEEGYLFSSITASYKCNVSFEPAGADSNLGILTMDLEEAEFVINDGQHRCAGIAEALKQNPALGDETISVLLFQWESIGRVQQMFSDLNRYVAKTSKSLDILYDKRDGISRVTLEIVKSINVFDGLVDMDSISLPTRSVKLFTLSSVYDATSELLGSTERTHHEAKRAAMRFWSAVAAVMPAWGQVKQNLQTSVGLRQEQICAHSVVLRALGSIGGEVILEQPDIDEDAWAEVLEPLKTIDWRKTNRDWENICIVANSVVSNRQARLATKAYLKRKLRRKLNDAELRALAPAETAAALGDERTTETVQ